MKKGLLTIMLFLMFIQSGWACSCSGLDEIDEVEIKEYALIFRGTAINVVRNEEDNIITFRIERLYKGQIQSSTIQIVSDPSSGMCGIFPKVGEQWLIYASQNTKYFHTYLCSRTVNLNTKARDYPQNKQRIQKDIAFLEARIRTKGRTNG